VRSNWTPAALASTINLRTFRVLLAAVALALFTGEGFAPSGVIPASSKTFAVHFSERSQA
jgi:hypothetical protein